MPFSNFYYWFVIIDRVHNLFSFLSVVMTVLTGVILFVVTEIGDEANKKYVYHSAYILIVTVLIAVFTPSKQDMIIMYSGDKLESILTSDKAKALGGKAYDVIDAAMSDYLKKTKKGD